MNLRGENIVIPSFVEEHRSYLKGCDYTRAFLRGCARNAPVAQVSPARTPCYKTARREASGSEGDVKKPLCGFPRPGRRRAPAKNSRMKSFLSAPSPPDTRGHWVRARGVSAERGRAASSTSLNSLAAPRSLIFRTPDHCRITHNGFVLMLHACRAKAAAKVIRESKV